MVKPITVDIGERCTHCGQDTSANTKSDCEAIKYYKQMLFVNRIPSGADGQLVLAGGDDVKIDVNIEGYMCIECQSVECDRCGESTPFYEILDLPIPELLCENCLEKHNASKKGESRRVVPSSEEYQAGLEKMPSGYYRQTCNDIYHYHDVARLEDQCGSECFDQTRSEIKENLESEREEFRAWILSNPAVGDKFYSNGNADVLLVERSK